MKIMVKEMTKTGKDEEQKQIGILLKMFCLGSSEWDFLYQAFGAQPHESRKHDWLNKRSCFGSGSETVNCNFPLMSQTSFGREFERL